MNLPLVGADTYPDVMATLGHCHGACSFHLSPSLHSLSQKRVPSLSNMICQVTPSAYLTLAGCFPHMHVSTLFRPPASCLQDIKQEGRGSLRKPQKSPVLTGAEPGGEMNCVGA